jgi:nucleotide-binding universal stress UspA family protein
MVKHALVPLDGTKNAEAALDALEGICDAGDEVVLLAVEKPAAPQRGGYRPGNVITDAIVGPAGGMAGVVAPSEPVYAETTGQALQRQIDEKRDYLEELATGLRHKGYAVSTEVLIEDKPDQAIIAYAKQKRPTFIVMLRRTHSALGELIFGSVASSVVRAEVAPVLFVPAEKS